MEKYFGGYRKMKIKTSLERMNHLANSGGSRLLHSPLNEGALHVTLTDMLCR